MGGRGSSSGGGGGNDPPVDPPHRNDPNSWTWEEFATFLKGSDAQDDEVALETTKAWLKAHQSTTTTSLKDDEMTKAENFYTVTTKDGIKVLFTKGNEENAAYTLMELAAGYETLPITLKQNITQIVMTTEANIKATASAGTTDNNIVFYNGKPIDTGTLAHEAAHNLAVKKWSGANPPNYEEGTDSYEEAAAAGKPTTSDYGKAISSGEPPVSTYGRTNPAEDFAEAIKLYVLNPGRLQQIAPKRYAVIHRLMTDPNYGG